jgi:hypothetical protein
MTVKQATRPIVLVSNVAYLICGLILVRLLFASGEVAKWMVDLLRDQIHLQGLWTGDRHAVVLLNLGGAALSTFVVSLYLVWIDRQLE